MLITCYSHSALPLNFALIYSVLQWRCILFKELGSHSVVQLAGTHHCPYQHRHSIGRLRHRVLTGISRFKIWNFSFAEKSQILRFFPQLKKQQELLTEMVKEQKVENRNEREENDNIEEFLERNVNFEKVLEQFVNQFQPKPEVKPEAE